MTGSALYVGTVVHQRVRPVRHRLRYRVFSLLVDVDELPQLDRRLRLFGHNRLALFSVNDADHGDGRPTGLRAWLDGQLASAGVAAGGAIRMLCYPRILGYVFNPLTVYFCDDRDGRLAALIYEVNNTFGERHCYLIPVAGTGAVVRQSCSKAFFVSPFNAVAGDYRFRVEPPDATVAIGIGLGDRAGPILHAAFRGSRRPLTDAALAAAFVRYPLMTFKVIVGIHVEAFRLWRRGLSLVRRPPPPEHLVTVIRVPPRPTGA